MSESAPSQENISPIKSDQKLHPSSQVSRRGLFTLVAGVAAAKAVDQWGFGSFPDSEGSLSQRSYIFTNLLKDIASAKVSGEKLKQDEAEKTLYMWTVCNAMELGARFGLRYMTAADNMRHFLYGNGSPVDLSKTFQSYLQAEYVSPPIGTHEWDMGSSVGIGGIINEEVNARNEQLKLTKKNSAEELVDTIFADGERSQEEPMLCGAGLALENQHNNNDWNVGLGASTVRASFELAGKNYRIVENPVDASSKMMIVGLKSYDVHLTDMYDWHAPTNIPLSFFTAHLLKQLTSKQEEGSFKHIEGMIDGIEKKFFPNGAKEDDINLLVRKGLAKPFPIKANASGKNLDLEIAIVVEDETK